MINPSDIKLDTLPWLPLEEKAAFPKRSAIYFAIDSLGTVQYIGRAVNMYNRWGNHHKYHQLTAIDNIKIAYLLIDTPQLLPEIENALIEYFQPLLNTKRLRNKVKKVCGEPEPRKRRPKSKNRTSMATYRLTPRVKAAIESIADIYGRSENSQAEYGLKIAYLHFKGVNVYGMTELQILEKFEEIAPKLDGSDNNQK